jgi:hypothetical protein
VYGPTKEKKGEDPCITQEEQASMVEPEDKKVAATDPEDVGQPVKAKGIVHTNDPQQLGGTIDTGIICGPDPSLPPL